MVLLPHCMYGRLIAVEEVQMANRAAAFTFGSQRGLVKQNDVDDHNTFVSA